MKEEYQVILCTTPNQAVAENIAHTVVGEKLAACCNIIPQLTSIYRWKGEIQNESEVLLIIKTRAALFDAIEDRISSLHPYEVPEIIALPVKTGNREYLDWVGENVKKQ